MGWWSTHCAANASPVTTTPIANVHLVTRRSPRRGPFVACCAVLVVGDDGAPRRGFFAARFDALVLLTLDVVAFLRLTA
ncbi:MAG TPA: hypothetical protein VII65_01640 [Acidimicrobiales bacterium]